MYIRLIITLLLLVPVIALGAISTYSPQGPSRDNTLKAWQSAQKYKNNHIIKSRGEYEAFSVDIHSQYGIKMISWSRWSQTNMDERAKKYKGAGLNAGLAVKVSMLCNTLRRVYGSDCRFYPSMVRTHGKGVRSRSQHRIDQGAKAVDLFIKSTLREKAFRMASNLNLTGLGVYTNHLNMLHVDTGNRRAWTHGYSRGIFVTLDNSHTRRPLYPPSEVLRYLGVSKDVVEAFGNGSVQYDTSQQALKGILSDYKINNPNIYAPGASVLNPPIYNIAPEDWEGVDDEYAGLGDIIFLEEDEVDALYEIIFILPQRRSSFVPKPSVPRGDFTYTAFYVEEGLEEKPEKKKWYQFSRSI